ncbi:MAG: ATP-binding protein [Enterobacterales bacterium]|nr:ATP-binding protein [Enterobacterales bacterium]
MQILNYSCNMHSYLPRNVENSILNRLKSNPAVALLGARQVGKSTLAKKIIQHFPHSIYLDLEKRSDLAKLTDPELFFQQFKGRLICLDEIQRLPEIFSTLRSVIDESGKNAQFLLLGSASRDLIQQSSESLAGRLSYIEVTPFQFDEISHTEANQQPISQHWSIGGYPRSYLSSSFESSFQWREDYIRTYLERDIPQLGFNIPANTLGRFWRMLAHHHGQTINTTKLAESMGVSTHKIRKYIDLLEQTFITRNLLAYSGNLKKRLVKSPKVYIRDSGLLHCLLDIENIQGLLAHPIYGASFEGYVIENILSKLNRWKASFFRSASGAEIDLVLEKGMKKICIEIKASSSPKPTRGFWTAIEDIKPDISYIVAPVKNQYPIKTNVWVIPMFELIQKLND